MGDTGSLFLGGAVCALAFGVDMPILLILIGIIYIVEILSVVLQVTYFKISHGKRIFKMAPTTTTLKCAAGTRIRFASCSAALHFLPVSSAYFWRCSAAKRLKMG